jgi:hypothetical protein
MTSALGKEWPLVGKVAEDQITTPPEKRGSATIKMIRGVAKGFPWDSGSGDL